MKLLTHEVSLRSATKDSEQNLMLKIKIKSFCVILIEVETVSILL